MTQIPIYRAKKIDSDEWVEGDFAKSNSYTTEKGLAIGEGNEIWNRDNSVDVDELSYPIDTKTLAIHFPNMLDKNKKRIFASLSEDGVGGDIFYIGDKDIHEIAIMRLHQLMGKGLTNNSFIGCGYAMPREWTVIGIHKG